MSSAGRPSNSTTGAASKGKHSSGGLGSGQAAGRRLRSNNTGNALSRSPSKRHDVANSPTKSGVGKDAKHDGSTQRILAILESVPSTISVSSHPSNSLPSNFNVGLNKKNERAEVGTLKNRAKDGRNGQTKRDAGRPSTQGSASGVGRRPLNASQRILKKHAGRRANRQASTNKSNGMPPPPVPTKMHFRARALDPQRQMPVTVTKSSKKPEGVMELEMLHNNKVLKRPLFDVPSGMEKEEERELHLRKAIEAQKSLTGEGVSIDHLIPIRQVTEVPSDEYASTWKGRMSTTKPEQYIPLRRSAFDFCDDDTSYDADEADAEFLETNGNFVSLDENFHRCHPEIVIEKLERIYDYWLERRIKLIRSCRMNASLVPYVPNKCRAGEKDNPYIAFRHRGPKVTTRRKQKMDTEHFGAMLKLAAAVRRSHVLSKGLVAREALKMKIVDNDIEMFDEQLEVLRQGGTLEDLPDMSEQQPPSLFANAMPTANKWLPTAWHEVARTMFDDPGSRREDSLQAVTSRPGAEDGQFAFHRHRHCVYRMPRPSDPSATPQRTNAGTNERSNGQPTESAEQESSPFSELHKSQNVVFKPSPFVFLDRSLWGNLTGEQRDVVCRSRFGRGGRLLLDFLRK
ncbi:Enhancer of polycomb-like protein 1-like protein [Aphelenchoides fujianensis]|nr:Enhancer of polycomb-like protein 1-like protein [Aphelenchoides fujianensis]